MRTTNHKGSRNLALLEEVLAQPASVFVWGPPGVGKSYAASQAMQKAGIKKQHIYQVTLTEDITVQEMFGHWVPDEGKWRFNLGPITNALMQGAIIINEIQRASASIQDYLLGVLDSEDVRQIDMPNGKRVVGHKGFRVVATSNGGPEELDDALRDRFEGFINVTHPATELVERLNFSMPGLGEFIYNSFDDEDNSISPRRAIAFLKWKKQLRSEKDAARLAFGDKADDALMVMRAGA
jgi:MoxR-like ATPase